MAGPGDLPAKNVSSCHSWQRPGIHRYASHRVVIPSSCHSIELSFLAQTRNPPLCLSELSFHRVVISSSCHSWRRPGIHRYASHRVVISSSCHSIELSFLAQTRNPPLCLSSSCHSIELSFHRVVIPGADQESTGLSIQSDSWIPGLRQE